MSVIVIAIQMVFDLIKVAIGCPAIGVNDCYKHVFWVYHEHVELFFHMLYAPWNIWGFSLLLIFSDFMTSVINVSEFWSKLSQKGLSLLIAVFLMFFHRQENQVIVRSSWVFWEYLQSLCKEGNIFLVAGNGEGVVQLLVELTDRWELLFLVACCSFQHCPPFHNQNKV